MLAGGLYEPTSGAAGQLLAGYRRREPERTVLHELDAARADDAVSSTSRSRTRTWVPDELRTRSHVDDPRLSAEAVSILRDTRKHLIAILVCLEYALHVPVDPDYGALLTR